MRASLTAMVGLALVATACSGSTSGTGGTTGNPIGSTTTGGGLVPGASCTYNGACASGICDLSGSGNCCLSTCTTGDPTCGATGCDSTGLCVYPQPAVSCGSTCTNSMVTPSNCDGSGGCQVGGATSCPTNLGCDSDGGCNTTCTASRDCAAGFVCNGGVCGLPIITGACTESDDCKSKICGVGGKAGNCCASVCSTSNSTCGATACTFDAGACVYPTKTVSCGSPESCANGEQLNASVCDGLGNCPSPATVQCAPFTCGATACLTSCTDSSACEAGDFCDAVHGGCCAGLSNLGNMAVDGTSGSDAACCGIGGKNPCQTLAHVMALIDAAGAQNVTITATVNGAASGDWPATETYPIVLGWGAELKAPGIFFSDLSGTGKTAIFDIKAFSANDTLKTASIIGTSGALVHIGSSAGGSQSTDAASIRVEGGATLYLANAGVNGSATSLTTALLVEAGGTLTLGENQSTGVTGTVTIGNSMGKKATDGYDGIVCGSATGTGCTITDATLTGLSSIIIEGQEHHDIDAEDFASITLISNPMVGVAPSSAGFGMCPTKLDASAKNDEAILLNGAASMTFNNGTVQCIAGDGFVLQASANGLPTLNLNKTTIQNTELGVYASAGTATIANSNIQFNYNGVEQDTDGKNTATIDLSGGKVGGSNTLVCANSTESIFGQGNGNPAIVVLNTTTGTLNASNVQWDTAGPDTFLCNPLTSCQCESSGGCSVTPGQDGMDAVYETTGLITTTGNLLSATSCQSSCGGEVCSGGEVCCSTIVSNCFICDESFYCESDCEEDD